MNTETPSWIRRRTLLKGMAAAAAGSIPPGLAGGADGGNAAAPPIGPRSVAVTAPARAPAPAPATSGASAPPTERTPASGFVNISPAQTSWVFASRALMAPWVNPGGDYVDAKGVFNGPTATITTTMAATTSVDISRIDGDLFLHPKQGTIWNAKIDGVAADAFWLDPTAGKSVVLPPNSTDNPNPLYRGVIVPNPKRGRRLTFETRYVGAPLRIDKVRGPAIPELPMIPFEGALPPDLGTLDPLSHAAVYAAVGLGSGAGFPTNNPVQWAFDPQPGVAAEHGNMPYLRLAITPANQKGIGWFWHMAPRDEGYLRYALYLEDSIAVGMTEAGVKLPGFEGVPGVSARMWHGPPDPANPHVYAAADYVYSGETAAGAYGNVHPFGQYLRAGRWYAMEQHVKNNSFTNGVHNADGVLEMWINGHLVYSNTKLTWYTTPGVKIFNKFFVNIYHGGMGFPSQNIYYRIARLAHSTTRIGPPAELLARSAGTRAVR